MRWAIVGLMVLGCGARFDGVDASSTAGAGGFGGAVTTGGNAGGSARSAGNTGNGGDPLGGGGADLSDDVVVSLQDLLVERPCVTPVADYCVDVDAPDDTRSAAGTAGAIYEVDIHVRGVVEGNTYANGSPQGMIYVGGNSIGTWDQYELRIDEPPSHYFLNSGMEGIRQTNLVDAPLTVTVAAGSQVALVSRSGDAECLQNMDASGMAISVDGTPVMQPFSGEFVYIEVLDATLLP